MRLLLPEPATPVTTVSTPRGTSTSTSRRLCDPAPRISSAPADSRHRVLECGGVSEVATGESVRFPETVDGAGEGDLSPVAARAGTEVDDVVGDEDRLGLVFDDEDRIALVPQRQQQVIHRADVVRMQADRRFVEDIGDVRERRTQVADQFDPLRLSPGQRSRRSVQRQISEADVV